MIPKTERIRDEFWEIDPHLRVILCDADYFLRRHGFYLFLTCLIRMESEERELFEQGIAQSPRGVHVFGRGGDARPTPSDSVNQVLLSYINTKYPYDPARPEKQTMIRHGGTGDHFHFQTMPTIKERED